jgi:ribosomal protein S8
MLLVNYKELKPFFLSLEHAIQKRQKYFIYPKITPNLLAVLSHLQKSSFILGYFRKQTELKIFLRYDNQSLPVISKIVVLPSLRYIKVSALNKFVNNYPYSLALISTPYGILNVSECQNKNCGGELIVTIN